jgi:hypothetical protein
VLRRRRAPIQPEATEDQAKIMQGCARAEAVHEASDRTDQVDDLAPLTMKL